MAHSKQLVLAAHVFHLGTHALSPHFNCPLPLCSLRHFKRVPLLQRSAPDRNLDTVLLVCGLKKGDTPPLQGPHWPQPSDDPNSCHPVVFIVAAPPLPCHLVPAPPGVGVPRCLSVSLGKVCHLRALLCRLCMPSSLWTSCPVCVLAFLPVTHQTGNFPTSQYPTQG